MAVAARLRPQRTNSHPRRQNPVNGGEGRFHELLEALPAAIYTTDATGRITFFNPAAAELSGRTPRLGIDRWCVTWRLYWPDGRPLPHDECPMAMALKEDRAIRGIEALVERPDGTRVRILPYPTPLHDASGRLVGAVNMLVDLTDRDNAECALRKLNQALEDRVDDRTRRLRESERRFRLFVQGVTDYAIFMMNPEGVITEWNAGAERIKGYRAAEIIGKHFSRFYTAEDREKEVPTRALATATREGRFETEGWRVRQDGTRFWANVVIDAIHDDSGALAGFAKITRDMTERRAVEEQLRQSQKMEAIGQLTGGLAHDFNNLFAAIIPNLELAQRRIKDQKARQYLANAIRSVDRGAKLMHQLLAFSRRDDIVTEPVDVNYLTTQLCEMLPRTIGPTIAVKTALAPDAWQAMTEPGQLELAILNLAINARDAMLPGGELKISTANIVSNKSGLPVGVKAGDYVMLSVADTGTGMSEEVRGRAFEPFYTTKDLGKGTGLGLSMVYAFAKQSGGAAIIDSETGRGTVVRLYLPRAKPLLDAADEAGARTKADSGPVGRILVVDDDDDVRGVTTTLLAALGHEAREAGNGREALDLLQQDRRFDLLMIDLLMPNMHGTAFAAEAQSLVPGVPVLFITGYNGASHAPKMSEAQYLIKKPFRLAELAEKLRDILRRHGCGKTAAARGAAARRCRRR
jgi:PAS domain S-box-containing protein